MAKKSKTVDAYFIRSKGVEIGPFRSRAAAVAEAKAIEASGDRDVKIKRVEATEDDFKLGSDDSKSKTKTKSKDDDSRFFDDDDEDEEDEDDEEDDDEDDDDDDEEEEEDEAPSVTHPFFRPIGGKKS